MRGLVLPMQGNNDHYLLSYLEAISLLVYRETFNSFVLDTKVVGYHTPIRLGEQIVFGS
jgi:hypothetical protein